MTVPSNELVDRLRERYRTSPPPPCPVCGANLKVAGLTSGQLTWGCSTLFRWGALEAAEDRRHWAESQLWSRVGDPDVIELIGLYEDALRTAERSVTLMREVQQR